MLDWLRRDPREEPFVEIGGRRLPVTIRRLDRARRMTLRLAPDGSEIRLSVPRWVRSAEAIAFAEARRDWLAHQLAAVPPPVTLTDGASLSFRGTVLTIRHEAAAPRRVVREDRSLVLGGPADSLAPRLQRWLQGEARALLPEDLAHYCSRAAVKPPPIALSGAKRRWGSCAADGTIRINWRLVMAPDAVRRSVVAHEVAHLLHFDHSPAFHDALARIFEGSVPEANRWLKNHGRTLYLPFG